MDEKKSFQDVIKERMAEVSQTVQETEAKLESSGRTMPMAYRTNAIIHMVAMGMTTKEISNQMKISVARVNAIMQSTGAKKAVDEIQQKMFFDNPQAMFKAMVPKAARTVKRLMLDANEKGSTRLGAASVILDRALGKAVQPVEHQGSAIKDLLMALDKNRAIPATASPVKTVDAELVEPEAKKDELDDWLDSNF